MYLSGAAQFIVRRNGKKMQSPNLHFKVVSLFIFLMLFHTTALADDQTDPVATAILNTIYQIKNVLIKQSSPIDIEEMIKQVRDKGATGYKTDRYSGGKSGWTLYDSKGREVLRVIFSFVDQKAKEGKYLDPLMLFKDAKKIHKLYREILSKRFKQLGTGKYEMDDNCMVFMELFKGSTGLGRTIIAVECY